MNMVYYSFKYQKRQWLYHHSLHYIKWKITSHHVTSRQFTYLHIHTYIYIHIQIYIFTYRYRYTYTYYYIYIIYIVLSLVLQSSLWSLFSLLWLTVRHGKSPIFTNTKQSISIRAIEKPWLTVNVITRDFHLYPIRLQSSTPTVPLRLVPPGSSPPSCQGPLKSSACTARLREKKNGKLMILKNMNFMGMWAGYSEKEWVSEDLR